MGAGQGRGGADCVMSSNGNVLYTYDMAHLTGISIFDGPHQIIDEGPRLQRVLHPHLLTLCDSAALFCHLQLPPASLLPLTTPVLPHTYLALSSTSPPPPCRPSPCHLTARLEIESITATAGEAQGLDAQRKALAGWMSIDQDPMDARTDFRDVYGPGSRQRRQF